MFRGMVTLVFGSVLGRTLGLLTVPILTRLYTPEDYGILAIYTAIVQMMLPVMTLRYVVAIPLPRTDRVALDVLTLSLLLLIAFAGVMTLGFALFGEALFGLLSAGVLVSWWGVVVLGIVTAGLSEILGGWVTRKRGYALLASRGVLATAIGETLKVGLGLLGLRPFGLLLGQLASQSSGVVGFFTAYRADFARIPTGFSWTRLWFVARYYISYPTLRLPSQFLLIFAMQMPLLFTAGLYGASVSGQMGLALMTLALPVNLIGQSIGKAFYAEVAHIGRARPAEIFVLTRKVQLRLLAIGAVPTVVLILFGPDLFAFAFGAQWEMAGAFAAMLAVYMLPQFTSSPLMQLLNVFNRQGSFLVINVIRTALLLVLFWSVRRFGLPVETYVRIYSWLMAVFYLVITLYVTSLTRRGTAR